MEETLIHKLRQLSLRQIAIIICSVAVASATLSGGIQPDATISVGRCYVASGTWCASQPNLQCVFYAWNYTAQKRIVYQCSGFTPINIGTMFTVYTTPCCQSLTEEPVDPVPTCDPACPNIIN